VNVKKFKTLETNLVNGPTNVQIKWLQRGLDQAGGKLPLFDSEGQKISSRTINSCLKKGWAKPWFNNPIKPDWLVCRLTQAGRRALLQK
jgi:hypothetical protein